MILHVTVNEFLFDWKLDLTKVNLVLLSFDSSEAKGDLFRLEILKSTFLRMRLDGADIRQR